MSFADQLGFTFQQATRRIWTVQDLFSAVRTQLEREYTDVWVQGEISNFRPAESGHLYFTLKDDGAQLRVVMFRLQARLLRFRPENGLQIIARGRVTVYEGRGELQLSAEFLEPRGAGALQIAFEQLKARLAAEGLFEQSRKKPIPLLPRRIGLVADLRAPTPSAAAEMVAQSKQQVEELVAGIHSRLGRAVRYRILLARHALGELAQRGALGRLQELVNRRQQRLDDLNFRLLTAHRERLRQFRRRLDDAGVRLQHHDLPRRLAGIGSELETRGREVAATVQRLLLERRRRVTQVTERLNDLSPLRVLERGYALVFDEAGELVKDAAQVSSGQQISARLSRGSIAAQVTRTSTK